MNRTSRARSEVRRRHGIRGLLVLSVWPVLLSTMGSTPAFGENTPVLRVSAQRNLGTQVVSIRINDSRELSCILDTGMPEGVFLFDPATGKDLELNYVAQAQVTGVGSGSPTASVAFGTTVTLGTVEFREQRVIVLDEPGALARLGVDGAIGASVFMAYVVEMDPENERVSLFDSGEFDPGAAAEAIPLTFAGTRPFVAVQVSLNGKETVPLVLHLDTGASRTLTLNRTSEPALKPPPDALPRVVSTGVGGDVRGSVGRVPRLRIGTHTLTGVIAAFPEGGQRDRNGTLGMGALRRFVVTLDYKKKRLLLRPNRSFANPFESNMAGVVLRPDRQNRPAIHQVFEGSPAAEAGIRRGDVLLTLDGEPLSWARYARTQGLFERAGRTIALTIDRDGTRLEVSVKLRRLI